MGYSCLGRGQHTQKPSRQQRTVLERTTAAYQAEISAGIGYLDGRGITDPAVIATARLGVVGSPEPGHEHLRGRLCIPYIDMVGVYGQKFRCLVDHDCKASGCPKYLALDGQEVGIYGIVDADSTMDTCHISEGELDRLILKQVFPSEPVLGIPGTQLWKPHHHYHFDGFERVLIWADGDKAGLDLAHRISKEVRTAELVTVPKGMDVTELFLQVGAETLRGMAGVNEEGD